MLVQLLKRLNWCIICHLLVLLSPSRAGLVNVTVDDSEPDHLTGELISYTPGLGVGWKLGQSCSDCTAGPQKTLAYHQTWHDSTFNSLPGSNQVPNQPLFAQFRFNGTAIYVYTILANTKTSPTGDSDMTFYLDGDVVGTFVKEAPGTPGFIYNVCVYANDSLPSGEHTLQIQNGHTDGNKTLLLLDYLIYSTDNTTAVPASTPTPTPTLTPTPTPTPTPQGSDSNDTLQTHKRDSNAVIIGAVLGALGGLLLLGFGWLWYRRWQFRHHGQWKGKDAGINKSQELVAILEIGEGDDHSRQEGREVVVESRESDSTRRWSNQATVAAYGRTSKMTALHSEPPPYTY